MVKAKLIFRILLLLLLKDSVNCVASSGPVEHGKPCQKPGPNSKVAYMKGSVKTICTCKSGKTWSKKENDKGPHKVVRPQWQCQRVLTDAPRELRCPKEPCSPKPNYKCQKEGAKAEYNGWARKVPCTCSHTTRTSKLPLELELNLVLVWICKHPE